MAKPKATSPFLSGRRIAPRPVRGSVRAADLSDQTFSAYNAARLRELFDGAKSSYRDIVLLNAAVVFIVAGRADTLKLGASLAAQEIDSGRARATLDKLVSVSNS